MPPLQKPVLQFDRLSQKGLDPHLLRRECSINSLKESSRKGTMFISCNWWKPERAAHYSKNRLSEVKEGELFWDQEATSPHRYVCMQLWYEFNKCHHNFGLLDCLSSCCRHYTDWFYILPFHPKSHPSVLQSERQNFTLLEMATSENIMSQTIEWTDFWVLQMLSKFR